MTEPKRKLKINMIDLESAFEHQDPTAEMIYYLDLETGEVEMTMGEERRLLERIYEEYLDEDTRAVDWPAVLPQLDLPEWQKDVLVKADLIEAGYGTRYIAIPQFESYEGYNEMVEFIDTVSNPHLQNRLEVAIHGKGAFRRFKDVLAEAPSERERWFRFQNERMRQHILDWLEEEGIELI